MKHADAEALARLAPLLAQLRVHPALREPRPGVFYRGSAAFLHFHVDPAGDFADLKLSGEWKRSRVVTRRERAELLRRVARVLAAAERRPGG